MDAERAESTFDVQGLASRLAAGSFLETGRLAAAAKGLRMTWQLDPAPDKSALWARVDLARAEPEVDELVAAIPARHTNRWPFQGGPLSPEDRQALEVEPGDPKSRLVLITEADKLGRMERLAKLAEQCRAECRSAHRDTNAWLRWTPEQVEATRDGLDVRTLGISAGQRLALKLMQPWAMMRVMGWLGAARVMGSYAAKLVRQSSALGVLAVSSLEPKLVVAAGQRLQRIWLRATQRKLGFSPIAALPLFALRIELLGGSILPPRRIPQLRAAGEELHSLAGLTPGERAVLLFRIGPAQPPPVLALRRRPEDLLAWPSPPRGSESPLVGGCVEPRRDHRPQIRHCQRPAA